ncbi:MAG: hypothetical protein E5V49_06345 [Mesorhizobium sp.]|nr:hypothetical protein EN848_09140 [bacterium M00.F.Ca.ET.205.01.1.1]TGU55870.1 hypothetical protein EN795_03885 [bacterium M00.F.Ca.ET.152.01.1.1]TGV39859.1 hypothetical protein EN829_000535 [Mesorhizobium sp. M00.F.Ca.ET.186.01.1.1]TGZ44839.1 hypothetical protein EN805_00535 [bacterium M00.F.Ca.ET.162.01.1.1]TJW33721.1 MAG: hypothetical protein E5V49_06345 [Mesorhizobium sp.]
MIELPPLRDPAGARQPLDADKPASILRAIMSLGEGFARDGIGASWLGFEIFVRWTSLSGAVQCCYSGRTRSIKNACYDAMASLARVVLPISG